MHKSRSFLFDREPDKIFVSTPLGLNPMIIEPAKQPKACEALVTGLLDTVKLGALQNLEGVLFLKNTPLSCGHRRGRDKGSESRHGKGHGGGSAQTWRTFPISPRTPDPGTS